MDDLEKEIYTIRNVLIFIVTITSTTAILIFLIVHMGQIRASAKESYLTENVVFQQACNKAYKENLVNKKTMEQLVNESKNKERL
jgi:hypothetical protein